ncbi:DUF6255 family natural product biosynthesis protein [Streptomyces sp. I05A-00742]|uniref:DUF6255 family natural product biosynthesis protein n=1 Tax=Streptomyces sp. I05A-00742 TaxID=2732853 RepID=UPI0037D9D221
MRGITPANCRHPATGWEEAGHVITCSACGVRRFPVCAALWWSAGERRAAGACTALDIHREGMAARRTHIGEPSRVEVN